jgi:hypothetical protein
MLVFFNFLGPERVGVSFPSDYAGAHGLDLDKALLVLIMIEGDALAKHPVVFLYSVFFAFV